MTYQYDQYQQQQSPQLQPSFDGVIDNKTTLWMGDLEPWMDENFIRQIWYQLGENVSVKIIRDKFTGTNAGYCFVDFVSNSAAVKALTTASGTSIPGTNRVFKLNWATGSGLADRKDDRGPEFSVFVGDLGPEVNEWMLVVGYGFVRFGEEIEQQRALVEMQGAFCGNRPIRISTATPKNKLLLQGGYFQQTTFQNPFLSKYNDPNNTTVFIGGITGINNEEELKSYFQNFGEITNVKIPPGKSCGFIQFAHRKSAEMAISQMQNLIIGNSRVRVSWGRTQTDKTSATAYRPQYNAFGGIASTTTSYNNTYTPVPTQQQTISALTQITSTPLTTIPSKIQLDSMDPLEPIPVQHLNDLFISNKEDLLERMEIDTSNWPDNIYA
nr:1482_t:CDS:2 [Entrophospora candida]